MLQKAQSEEKISDEQETEKDLAELKEN